jgi:cysteine-rich repeat protein
MRRLVCLTLLLFGCYPVTVSPPDNLPPRAQGELLPGTEDQTLQIEIADLLANDLDPDGDNLTVTATLIEGSATNGTATQNATQIIFTPNLNFAGVASFSYLVLDAEQTASTPAIVNIDIAPIADFPVALLHPPVVTQEDTPITITLLAADVDGGDLNVEIIKEPDHGSLTLLSEQQASAAFLYTPNVNFNGADTLQFRAIDPGGLTSGTTTVSISIAAQNDPPVAVADLAPTPVLRGGQSIIIPVLNNDTDIDNAVNTLTPQIVIPPLQGTAAVSGANIVYTSDAITTGDVIFFYSAKDANASSVPAQVTVTVVAGCGDGVVTAPERCDDNNTLDLDGCNTDCNFTCANNADPESAAVLGASCYAVFREGSTDFKQNWNDAKTFCATNNSDLVIINDAAENNFLRSVALLATDLPWIGGTDQEPPLGPGEEDLTDQAPGDDFQWSDGVSFSVVNFFHFAVGQPNNSNGNEDCLFMLDDGQWDDTNCVNPPNGGLLLVNSMICEFPLP